MMPFCPQCRGEYREGFTVCSDCDVPLVTTLPEEPPPATAPHSRENWIELLLVTSPERAGMVKGALDAKGIPAVVISTTGHFGLFGLFSVSSYIPIKGGYTVMVPKEHREDAEREAETVLGDLWEKVRLTDSDSSEA